MSAGRGCDAVAPEGLESDIDVLLRGKHNGSQRNRRFGRRSLITLRTGRELRSDHPLLAIGLKVTYDLRNDADQLARNVGHILLRQLSLLAKGHGTAER